MVPAYGSRSTLARTLESLTVDNADGIDRVIVVCSPAEDRGQRAVAESFPGVSVISVARRISAGAARNLGARYGRRSEYILFVDADCRLPGGGARRLLDQARTGAIDCLAASILPSRCDPVSITRHLLEFKDSEPGVPPRPEWMVPSATLLCRRDAFVSVGGFPDLWPGEDLIFCRRLHGSGFRTGRSASVTIRHEHPRGVLELLRHQVRLGRTSAVARLSTDLPGSVWARRPWLAPMLFAGRLGRMLVWLVGRRPRRLPVFIVLLPLYLGGLAAWSYGFTVEAWRWWGSRDAGGSHTPWTRAAATAAERDHRPLEHP